MSRGAEARRQASFRFYAELNDFLPSEQRGREQVHRFLGRPAVKDAIEALGVPHTEVEVILIGGHSVGFDERLTGGERVSVYPVFESLDVSPVLRLRPEPLREPRFVLDQHLGKLARLLRLLGFDSLYRNDYEDAEIVRVALAERRIILTRDRGLLKRGDVTHGYWLRSTAPREQARELLERFDLRGRVQALRRCVACNTEVHAVAKEAIAERLPPKTREHYDEFWLCDGCGRVYWRGSHYARLLEIIRTLTS